jgi:hypothetical protein
MHVKGFLHKKLSDVMHKKRLETLSLLVETVLMTKRLSLTELGREMVLPIKERSAIRRVDRFLGNMKLQHELFDIQKTMASHMIVRGSCPWIIVDWSEIPNSSNHVLRAALIAEGRAITLYEEVHPEQKLSNPTVEEKFLKKLQWILPEDCHPIIVTDAGFHNKWFKEVLNLGWNYVGRIRSGKKYSLDDGATWNVYTELFPKATRIEKSLCGVLICRNNPLVSNLYLYKGKSKGRSLLNRSGEKRRDTNSMDHRKSAREPWVLASSLSGRSMGKRVIKIYKKRMQIEEGFRDLKSSRYGFGFENAHTKKRERIKVLLLIAALASFTAWLVGWITEKNKLHYQFQSNTIKKRRVLSLFYLGCRAIKKKINIKNSMLEMKICKGLTYAA